MAVTVKKVALWRRELDNRPGALAQVLEPLARAGTDLQVAMGYRFPGNESRAAVEIAPVTSGKATSAARTAGLQPSEIPTLMVAGDNRPGLGYALSRGMSDAGINMAFLVAQVIGPRFSGVFGFESEADADRAAVIIKKTAGARTAAGARKTSKARKAPATARKTRRR
jgi:hypothetical protein